MFLGVFIAQWYITVINEGFSLTGSRADDEETTLISSPLPGDIIPLLDLTLDFVEETRVKDTHAAAFLIYRTFSEKSVDNIWPEFLRSRIS